MLQYFITKLRENVKLKKTVIPLLSDSMTNHPKKNQNNTPPTQILTKISEMIHFDPKATKMKTKILKKIFGPREGLRHFRARASPAEFQLAITWLLIELQKFKCTFWIPIC